MKIVKLILDCIALLVSLIGGFLYPFVWIVTVIQAISLIFGFWQDYKTDREWKRLQREHNKIPEVQGQHDLDAILKYVREKGK